MDNNKKMEISQLFLNIICSFFEKDKKSGYFGTDTQLFHSEIHMVQFIKENENLHISAIARQLGVTRGAVSQIIKRLEKKGIVYKASDTNNSRKLILHLTQKGETAYLNHKKQHSSYDTLIMKLLENAKNDELDFLMDFLLKFKNML